MSRSTKCLMVFIAVVMLTAGCASVALNLGPLADAHTFSCERVPGRTGEKNSPSWSVCDGEFWRDMYEVVNRDKRGTTGVLKKQRAPQVPLLQRDAKHVTLETEREGFEPSVRLPVHTISSRVPSAARTPLLNWVLGLCREGVSY